MVRQGIRNLVRTIGSWIGRVSTYQQTLSTSVRDRISHGRYNISSRTQQIVQHQFTASGASRAWNMLSANNKKIQKATTRIERRTQSMFPFDDPMTTQWPSVSRQIRRFLASPNLPPQRRNGGTSTRTNSRNILSVLSPSLIPTIKWKVVSPTIRLLVESCVHYVKHPKKGGGGGLDLFLVIALEIQNQTHPHVYRIAWSGGVSSLL